ncbi:MAG: isocitrate/isopropylmalate family dehydrogenase, partial [Anaerolineae bacterium]
MHAKVVVLGGDGIGPEVTGQAVRVLRTVGERYGQSFEFEPALLGGCAI